MPPEHAAAEEFDRLLRDHVAVLHRYAYRWTNDVDRAEDLVQDLLTRLFTRLEELKQLDRVRPWAVRVMYRLFVDAKRREMRSPVIFGQAAKDGMGADEDEAEGEFPDFSAEPSALAERQITQERIIAAWSLLSDEHRVVISMHDIEGYSLEELAQVAGVAVGTIKSRLHRARARLRELLAEGTISAPGACLPVTVAEKAGRG